MFDKKAGIATEEIFGMVTFMIVAAIAVLLFFGCSVKLQTQEYTAFELQKDEIEAIKSLNFFLEMPHPTNPEKMVMDLVVESYLSETDDAYCELDSIAREYFSTIHNNRILRLGLSPGYSPIPPYHPLPMVYRSQDCNDLNNNCVGFDLEACEDDALPKFGFGDPVLLGTSEVMIPIFNENLELTEIRVVFDINRRIRS
ncbi:MAG: hypothetical protein QQN41_12035 [Nitrosopumilus sp.]